jgi:trk system potassium uptake protein TrkH
MLLTALNFNLYYRIFRGKFREVAANSELKAYLGIFFTASIIITLSLIPVYGSVGGSLRHAAYQTASFLSTTGSAIADYETWPSLARMVLFSLLFIGGCSGSTAGGFKVIRHVVLFKQAGNELKRIFYPQGIFNVRLNHKVGRKDVVYSAAGFLFLYLAVIAAVTLIGAATWGIIPQGAASGGSASGIDLFTSLTAALSVTGNLGVGFGAVGPAHTFGGFPAHIKWLYSFVMIAGRLELWTVLILFTPGYWRR